MSIITAIVDGMHVSLRENEVCAEVARCVKNWDTAPVNELADVMHEAVAAHRKNRALYRAVMGGHIR